MRVAILFPNLNANPQMLDVGVAYLATYVAERSNHEVRIIDTTFHRRDWRKYVQKEIADFSPDVLAVSAMSVIFDYAKEMIEFVRSICKINVILGGYQAIMLPEETINYSGVDAICTGEGELTLTEYLDTLENGGSLRGVNGIWYREGDNIIKNPNRYLITDLDLLPTPNYDLFPDIDTYLFFIQRLYVIGTRGCPYRCSFCAETALEEIFKGKRFRERDPRKYVLEIKYLYEKYGKRGMNVAHLFDTVFTYNGQWLSDWVDEYKRQGLDHVLPYTVFIRPDKHNANDLKIELLASSNCQQVRMGVESGDDNIRKKELNKLGCTNDDMFKIFKKLITNGILVKTYSIIGLPHENKNDMIKTLNFNKSNLIQVAFYLSYTPIPGTPMAKRTKGMNTSKNSQKYSFHFSKGAIIDGIPKWYVPLTLIKAYLYYGIKLSWNTFMSNKILFPIKIIPRVLLGLKYGAPFIYIYLYGVINPLFWPSLIKRSQRQITTDA